MSNARLRRLEASHAGAQQGGTQPALRAIWRVIDALREAEQLGIGIKFFCDEPLANPQHEKFRLAIARHREGSS